jgi:hypothetical protein
MLALLTDPGVGALVVAAATAAVWRFTGRSPRA